ncbi:MAG TPA: gliding motility-associated C-terminal domain-containing protein, partial [Chryseosolibacter sp.]
MISGGSYGQVAFFRNTDGAYVHETGTSPFANIYVPYTSATNLVDIDADGDLDLFITNSIGEMFHYKNTGSAQIPEFIFETAENNLLETASGFSTWPISFLEFKDLDHDGDLDLIFNGSNQSQQPGEFLYFENTGTKENPAFTDFFWNFLPGAGTGSLQTEFLDVDGDGDVDVFVGNQYGAVSLLKNENPTVTITIADTPLSYENGADPVLIEPGLILFDEDNDFIIQATVNIENYLPGETLAFTPLGNISGIFDTSTGVLTLRGKGTVDEYQTVLRTVTFEVTYSSGRRTSGKNTLIGKSISIAVYDQDFTNPKVVSKSLEVFVNDPPAINTHTLNVIAGKAGTVDLKAIITDPNGAGDLDLNTLTVIDQPASGAVTSIDANGILRVDYNTLNFTGTETMVIQVCDLDGACVQNSLTVIVVNTPPVMAPQSVTTLAGTSVTINLIDFTSDADGNLDPNSFSIVANPANASSASIEVMSATEVNLIISYEGSTFYGSDELTIRACDLIGSCVQYTLAITVANTPPVIQPEPVSTPSGVTKTINLMTITSDVDGNLNPEGFSIVSPPVSNAIASIVVVSPTVVNLLMDYDGIVFNGMDALTIRACDKAGACTESIIQIQADVDASHSVMVFNAVAPNSSGNNRFMRISGLPQENKVSIFNRWGDKVYHTENYSNDPSLNAFQGLNNNGNSLPSGTYFYTIEIPGRQAVTGYLTLKQ